MPLFDFKCSECAFKKEHFIASGSAKILLCPKCNSAKYKRLLSVVSTNVEYSSAAEIVEHKIDPFVKETHEKIGREAINLDTKTLDNLFGEDKVKKTFYGNDD